MEIDLRLVERVRDGDPDAEDAFVRSCRSLVLGIAHGRFRMTPDEAEEVLQQTMLRLFQEERRALKAWRGEGKFSTYLTVIVTRLCLGRGKREERDVSLDDADLPAKDPSADDALASVERRRALAGELRSLRPRDRLLLRLRYGDGREPTEFAPLLGLSPAAARKGLHDALRRLRRRVEVAHPELISPPISNAMADGDSHSPRDER